MKRLLLLLTLFASHYLVFGQDKYDYSFDKQSEMLQDSVFYPKPCNLLSLNFSSSGDNIKAGETFFKIDTAVGLNKICLKSKIGHTLILSTTKEYNAYSDFEFHFWSGKYVDRLKKRFGVNFWKEVLARRVKIGWTREMCEISWGYPNDKNITTSNSGRSEQWVYSSSYLYFTNNKLTTIQN